MLYIAICDNMSNKVNEIKRYLLDYQKNNSCKIKIDCFICGEDLCDSSVTYDLVFLGLKMKRMDGLETAKLLRKKHRNTQIVYIAENSKFAVNAFEAHPFYFIVWPAADNIFFKVMNEFMEYFNYDNSHNNIIEFKGINGPLLLDQTNIYIFEYIGNRRVSVFTQSKKYVIRGGISEMTQLVDSEFFMSPHRSFLVNMQHVKSLNNYILYMKNDIEIPIAQRKLREVQRFLSCLKSETKIKI